MANFSSNLPLNIDNPLYGLPDEVSSLESFSSSHIVARMEDGSQVTMDGNFALGLAGDLSGTVTGLSWTGGMNIPGGFFNLSGLSVDIDTLYNLELPNDPYAIGNYVFSGHDSIVSGGYDDIILGFDGNDTIDGGAGNDNLNGNKGFDVVYGGLGDDYVRGGQGNDHVEGNDGEDTVNGNIGNDSVYGGSGNDFVYGGQDDDVLYGEDGNDQLSGDRGNDMLTGGNGNDVFMFSQLGGTDHITDFQVDADDIGVSSLLKSTVADVLASISYNDGHATIDLGQGVVVIIDNVGSGIDAGSVFIF